MDLGMPRSALAQRLIGPAPVVIRRAVVGSCIAILWGAAWFVGSEFVEDLGWLVLVVATVCGMFWRMQRRLLRLYFRLDRLDTPTSETYTRRQKLIVALAMSSTIYWWPLRVSLFVQRPFLDHLGWYAYAVAPAIDPPSCPRWAGLIVFTKILPDTHGAWLSVAGGGQLRYQPEDPFEYDWRFPDVPCYARWTLPPCVGPWAASPSENCSRIWAYRVWWWIVR
jgi:hypothetical protein